MDRLCSSANKGSSAGSKKRALNGNFLVTFSSLSAAQGCFERCLSTPQSRSTLKVTGVDYYGELREDGSEQCG